MSTTLTEPRRARARFAIIIVVALAATTVAGACDAPVSPPGPSARPVRATTTSPVEIDDALVVVRGGEQEVRRG